MQNLFLALVTLIGVGVTIQAAANARMREAVLDPTLGACINFAIGGLMLLTLAVSGIFGRGQLSAATTAPWWAWTGGLIGAAYVTMSIIAIPRLGAAVTFSAIIFGQMIGSLLLDANGWLNVPQIPISGWRILGTVMLFSGVILIQQK